MKLNLRDIRLEHIARMIKTYDDRLGAALQHAREAMPAELSEQQEGQPIDATELAKQLRQSQGDSGLEPPDDP